jgi:hypothetical protein
MLEASFLMQALCSDTKKILRNDSLFLFLNSYAQSNNLSSGKA